MADPEEPDASAPGWDADAPPDGYPWADWVDADEQRRAWVLDKLLGIQPATQTAAEIVKRAGEFEAYLKGGPADSAAPAVKTNPLKIAKG